MDRAQAAAEARTSMSDAALFAQSGHPQKAPAIQSISFSQVLPPWLSSSPSSRQPEIVRPSSDAAAAVLAMLPQPAVLPSAITASRHSSTPQHANDKSSTQGLQAPCTAATSDATDAGQSPSAALYLHKGAANHDAALESTDARSAALSTKSHAAEGLQGTRGLQSGQVARQDQVQASGSCPAAESAAGLSCSLDAFAPSVADAALHGVTVSADMPEPVAASERANGGVHTMPDQETAAIMLSKDNSPAAEAPEEHGKVLSLSTESSQAGRQNIDVDSSKHGTPGSTEQALPSSKGMQEGVVTVLASPALLGLGSYGSDSDTEI